MRQGLLQLASAISRTYTLAHSLKNGYIISMEVDLFASFLGATRYCLAPGISSAACRGDTEQDEFPLLLTPLQVLIQCPLHRKSVSMITSGPFIWVFPYSHLLGARMSSSFNSLTLIMMETIKRQSFPICAITIEAKGIWPCQQNMVSIHDR